MSTINSTAPLLSGNYETDYEIPVVPTAVSYDHLPTKSAKIRAMYRDGIKKTVIATTLNIRYQHVRNVLTQPAPKSEQ